MTRLVCITMLRESCGLTSGAVLAHTACCTGLELIVGHRSRLGRFTERAILLVNKCKGVTRADRHRHKSWVQILRVWGDAHV